MSKDHESATKAKDKPAALGPDINVNKFTRETKSWESCPISQLPEDVLRRAYEVGIVPEKESRSGTFFQSDHSVTSRVVQSMFEGKAEVMSTADAMKKYNWLKDYWWKVVKVDADKYTSLAETKWDQGYFIRILEDQKVMLPLQACLFISTNNLDQNVHNIIIAEAGSESQLNNRLYNTSERQQRTARWNFGIFRQGRREAHLHHDPQLGGRIRCSPEISSHDRGQRSFRKQLPMLQTRKKPPDVSNSVLQGRELES